MSEFYTYTYLREKDSNFPKGSVYYVGKGKGRRAFCNQRNVPIPKSREDIHIQYWPDENTALAFERYLVDFYGRVDLGTGCLRNLTDGGIGHGKPSESALIILRENGRRVGTMLYKAGRLPHVKDFATPESRSKGGKKRIGNTYARKLTDPQIQEIRQLLSSGNRQNAIARRYGVHPSSISLLCSGKTFSKRSSL